jgi:tetratricopeptide (TPR) repeat protein
VTDIAATTVAPAKRRWYFWALIAIVLLGGAGIGAYFIWRPLPTRVPVIRTEGLDPEVVAAIDQARSEVAANPKSAAAWGHLGMVLFAQDMYADCVGILAEAERLDASDPRWPYLQGLALILNKPDDGVAALQRAANLSPHSVTERLRLAEEYLKLDRLEQAETLFSALLADYPNNPRALLGWGLILSRRGRWQEAIAPLRTAAEDPTAKRSANIALIEVYVRLKDFGKAESARKVAGETSADIDWPDSYRAEALALRTGLQPRVDRVVFLLKTNRVEEAADLAQRVVGDHPNSDEAHLTLAKVLISKTDFPAADKELRRAIEINPDLVDGHFLLAGIQMQNKNYKAAEREYQRTVDLKPSYGLAHYILGDCRLKLKKRSLAMDSLRAAIRSRPDLALAHLQLGALLLEDSEFDKAVEQLEDAVRLDATNERARKLLEEARAKMK